MEDGFVTISRVKGTLCFPSKFILVCASNPCPCGYYGENGLHRCQCSLSQILKYQKKISGPLLDRVDLYLNLQAVDVNKLTAENETQIENSATVKKRVEMAREKQHTRFAKTAIVCNSEIRSADLKKYCPMSPEVKLLLREALIQLGLSARSYQKTIKVARTIADLSQSDEINTNHMAEALQYRRKNFDQ